MLESPSIHDKSGRDDGEEPLLCLLPLFFSSIASLLTILALVSLKTAIYSKGIVLWQ